MTLAESADGNIFDGFAIVVHQDSCQDCLRQELEFKIREPGGADFEEIKPEGPREYRADVARFFEHQHVSVRGGHVGEVELAIRASRRILSGARSVRGNQPDPHVRQWLPGEFVGYSAGDRALRPKH